MYLYRGTWFITYTYVYMYMYVLCIEIVFPCDISPVLTYTTHLI